MKKTIHIFDLDNTLIENPMFVDFLEIDSSGFVNTDKDFSDYFLKIKSLFWDKLSKNILFKKSGDFVIVVDADTKKPISGTVIDSYFSEKKYRRFFDVKNNIIIIEPFPGFHSDENTLGNSVNKKLFDIYNSIENKMILTGRDESLRQNIMRTFDNVELKHPKFGIHLYQKKGSVRDYKLDVILKSIEENNWNEIHFYEDRADWLYFIEGAIKEEYPNIKFVSHYISNLNDKKTL